MKKSFIVTLLIILSILLVACGANEKEISPKDPFDQYIQFWNEKKFDQMYVLLSNEAQEKITKEEFVERYSKIYDDLQVDDLKVENTSNEELELEDEQTEITFPYHVSMKSFAGDISFEHEMKLKKIETEEDKKKIVDWKIEWNPSLIFPDLEEGDRLVFKTTPAERGDILDRSGLELAETGEAIQIGLIPGDMGDQEQSIINELAKSLDIEASSIEKALNANWVQPDFFVPIKSVSSSDEKLLTKLLSIQAVTSMSEKARIYPLAEAAAHLTGNIGTVTAEDIEANPDANYSGNDTIGKRGLEKVLENRLRGENGVIVEIQKENGITTTLVEKEVKNGENVQLTIDFDIQRTVYEELKDVAGSAIVLDPKTGETLALVSTPTFDPNVLSLGATNSDWDKIQNDPNKPLTIRFNQTYAPGSAFKPISAMIALNEKAADWQKTIDIKGLSWQKDSSWGGYKVTRVSDHGAPVGLEKALIYSDNIYFAQTALNVGKDKFVKGLKDFGFDEEIPYLYPVVNSNIGDINSDIILADSSYGQGQIEMSLIHLATSYTPLVNKGNMIKPLLEITEEKAQVWKENVVSEKEAGNITKALRKVVTDPKGTGKAAKIEGYPLAGKTGTAEIKMTQGEKGKENGTFVAFNPDNPEYLIAMIVEDVDQLETSGIATVKTKNIFEKLK